MKTRSSAKSTNPTSVPTSSAVVMWSKCGVEERREGERRVTGYLHTQERAMSTPFRQLATRYDRERRWVNVYLTENDGATVSYAKVSEVNEEIKRLEESIADPDTRIEVKVKYSETTNQLTQAGVPVTTEDLLAKAKKQLEDHRTAERARIAQLQAGLEKRRANQREKAAKRRKMD
jgi:hypothetical protein